MNFSKIQQIPHCIQYFSLMSDNSDPVVIGTGKNQKIMFELKHPGNYKHFGEPSKVNIKSEIIVEFNQKDKAIFLDNSTQLIEVFDVRNEKKPILQVQCQNPVIKLEFNPFNKDEFLILFDRYFV